MPMATIKYWLRPDGTQLRANPARGIDNWHTYIGAAYLEVRGIKLDPDSQDGEVYDAMFDLACIRVTEHGNKLWADSNGHRQSTAQQEFFQSKQREGFDVVLNNITFVAAEDGQQHALNIAKAA